MHRLHVKGTCYERIVYGIQNGDQKPVGNSGWYFSAFDPILIIFTQQLASQRQIPQCDWGFDTCKCPYGRGYPFCIL